jgi:Protein of unknown function (DUF1403)
MDVTPNHFSNQRLVPVPAWARNLTKLGATDAAFQAGAALAALDARVRAQAPVAGVWRCRLALAAAATSARMRTSAKHISAGQTSTRRISAAPKSVASLSFALVRFAPLRFCPRR